MGTNMDSEPVCQHEWVHDGVYKDSLKQGQAKICRLCLEDGWSSIVTDKSPREYINLKAKKAEGGPRAK